MRGRVAQRRRLCCRGENHSKRKATYRHILIPTDGSELSKRAVQHGVDLAKSLGAQVTAMTVSMPFHIFAIEPAAVTDTPESYARKRPRSISAR